MLENGLLNKTFGPKEEETTSQWRILHNEGLYDLCSSTNIIWLIKSRKKRWARHVASMGTGEIQDFGGDSLWWKITWKTQAQMVG